MPDENFRRINLIAILIEFTGHIVAAWDGKIDTDCTTFSSKLEVDGIIISEMIIVSTSKEAVSSKKCNL
jgi:hypothetical protein